MNFPFDAGRNLSPRTVKERTDFARFLFQLTFMYRVFAKLMQAVIGTTKATRVIDSAKAGDIELTRKQWYEIYLAAGN